jgi:hypothetical protein
MVWLALAAWLLVAAGFVQRWWRARHQAAG